MTDLLEGVLEVGGVLELDLAEEVDHPARLQHRTSDLPNFLKSGVSVTGIYHNIDFYFRGKVFSVCTLMPPQEGLKNPILTY